MKTIISKEALQTFLIDLVAVKSKMILNQEDLKIQLRKSTYPLAKSLLTSENSYAISVRPEEVQELLKEIRRNIGDYKDIDGFAITKLIAEDKQLYDDFTTVTENFITIAKWHRNQYGSDKPLGEELYDKMIQEYGVQKKALYLFFLKMSSHLNQSIGSDFSYSAYTEPINLDTLFKSEQLPETQYFDQRFINFLFENENLMDKIHWRQFEGLVAEYFSREGYSVHLGKGRKDGGIDIIAKNTINDTITIIQCKKYKEDRPVSIESVKAFCFDLIDGKYDQGVIVTTSYLTDGEKKLYQNKYNISEIEKNDLKNLLFKMLE